MCRSLTLWSLIMGVSSKIAGQTLHESFVIVLFNGGKSSTSYIFKNESECVSKRDTK